MGLAKIQDIVLSSMATRIGMGRISNCGNAIPGTTTCSGPIREMAYMRIAMASAWSSTTTTRTMGPMFNCGLVTAMSITKRGSSVTAKALGVDDSSVLVFILV